MLSTKTGFFHSGFHPTNPVITFPQGSKRYQFALLSRLKAHHEQLRKAMALSKLLTLPSDPEDKEMSWCVQGTSSEDLAVPKGTYTPPSISISISISPNNECQRDFY